jgi:hypothetical protein
MRESEEARRLRKIRESIKKILAEIEELLSKK